MILNEVHILSTSKTPEYLFSPDGNIKIKGRGVIVNLTESPPQIMNWIDSYLVNPADITTATIAFDYLNSYSTVILTSILRKLSQGIKQPKKLVIKWYYEDIEDDIFNQGEYISSMLNIPFELILTKSIANI